MILYTCGLEKARARSPTPAGGRQGARRGRLRVRDPAGARLPAGALDSGRSPARGPRRGRGAERHQRKLPVLVLDEGKAISAPARSSTGRTPIPGPNPRRRRLAAAAAATAWRVSPPARSSTARVPFLGERVTLRRTIFSGCVARRCAARRVLRTVRSATRISTGRRRRRGSGGCRRRTGCWCSSPAGAARKRSGRKA